MTFGQRLQQLREEKSLLQKDLAEVLGITQRAISFYESDDRFPKDPISLVKIADFYNVSLDWLLCRSEHRECNKNVNSKDLIDVSSLSEEDKLKIEDYVNMIKKLKQK